ncbi:MAG TPA: ABC transporter substrate-binding protein, partial [Chloroflexota bacterium]|nr:ABC transporter substrate-binding protein [Chloroflexota bacterium]
KPRLAESWEIAPDLKSITFKLRRGVKFHSGTPFNADAVVFSFDRIFKEGDPNGKDGQFLYKSFVPFYEKTEKLDDLTVRVVFNQTDALILQRFALDTSYIADPEAVKKHGNRDYSTDAKKYSGTGPYKSVELQPQQLVRLERNEDWWGTPKPAFKNLVFRLFGRDQAGGDARVNALLAREIDVGLYLPGTRRNDLAKAAGQGLETQWFPQFVLGYFYINHTLPVFKDKRIRQAMARSLDRKKFLEATTGPTTIPHSGFWYPDSPFYNKDASLEFDPALAKKLLEDAGFTKVGADGIRERPSDGTRLSFNFTFGGTAASPPDVYTFWQQQLKELIGAEAKMLPFDPGISHEFEKGPLGPQNLGISSFGVGTWLGDPEFAYDRWITEKRGPVGFNHSQYSNPEMDSLYKQSRGIGDPEKRAEIFKKMQAIAAEDVAWIPFNITTLGGAWWKDRASNITAGATQYSYPWTYELPKG